MGIVLVKSEDCESCKPAERAAQKISEERGEEFTTVGLGDKLSRKIFEDHPGLIPTTCRVNGDDIGRCSTGWEDKDTMEKELFG